MKGINRVVVLALSILLLCLAVGAYLYSPRVADTEEQIFPDSRDRTMVRMRQLEQLLLQYASDSGALPERLQPIRAVRGVDTLGADSLPLDAWGRAITYERRDSAYLLRSAGEDGRIGTADDLRVFGAIRQYRE